MRVLLALIALLIAPLMATGAMAEPADTAKSSVARIVTAVRLEDGSLQVKSGSAFAVAGNLLVTNKHVIVDALGDSSTLLFVVPPNQGQTQAGTVIWSTDSGDLALVRIATPAYAPLTLTAVRPGSDLAVHAIGYPGTVDEVYDRSIADLIRPATPVDFVGNVSSYGAAARLGAGATAIVHSAKIGHGNSGGPLIDECGRVIGVNTALMGDYNLSTSADDIFRMLSEAGVSPLTSTDACESAAARAQHASDKVVSDTAVLKQELDRLRLEQAVRDKADHERTRNVAIGVTGLVLALGIGATMRARRRTSRPQAPLAEPIAEPAVPATASAGGIPKGPWRAAGALALVAAVIAGMWITQTPPFRRGAATAQATAGRPVRRLQCVSRSPLDSARIETSFDLDEDGCVNGRTLYASNGQVLERVMRNPSKHTATLSTIDRATGAFRVATYPVDGLQFEAIDRVVRRFPKGCPTKDDDLAALQQTVAAGNRESRDLLSAITPSTVEWSCR